MNTLLSLLLVIAVAIAETAAGDGPIAKLHVNKDGMFEDKDGFVHILHGTTFVDKNIDVISVSDETIDVMTQDWGWNIARVGFEWMLLETAPGVYNETYLKKLEDLVDRFGANGVYSFLDMHQDCWAKLYCGHGLPDFYALPYNFKPYKKGGAFAFPEPVCKPKYANNDDSAYPFITNCGEVGSAPLGWASCYAAMGMGSAAQRFYDNREQYLTKFGDMWAMLARRFAGKPWVLGYELINEPWIGDPYTNPLIWSAAMADLLNLHKMNQYLHNRIREFDNDTIILFEPATGGNLNVEGVGYREGPGGPSYNDRQALSYHQYCYFILAGIGKKNAFIHRIMGDVSKTTCHEHLKSVAKIRNQDIKKLGGGGLLTEFGAPSGPGDVPNIDASYLMQQLMDQYLQGWVFWLQIPGKDVDPRMVHLLTGSFVRKAYGKIISMNFSNSTGQYDLVFSPKAAAKGTVAELYAHKAEFYPLGLRCFVQPAEAASCETSANSNFIAIQLNSSLAQLPSSIHVTLTNG